MLASPIHKSLFSHFLLLCVIVAVAVCTVATAVIYKYRYNIASDRLAVEVTNAARSIAPLLIKESRASRYRETRQLFRIFAAYPSTRCVNFFQREKIIQSWPAPRCMFKPGQDMVIDLPIGARAGEWMLAVHTDLRLLRRSAAIDTGIFAAVITVIVLLIFLGLTASFRYVVLTPLDRLKSAMNESRPEKPILANLVRDDEIGKLVSAYNQLAESSHYYLKRLTKSQQALSERERLLDETNRNLSDSVQYASNIQRTLLVSREVMSACLGKTMAIWQPKDFVGGDFYWFKKICGRQYLVFFDCTGHGVPGAFMTMIVISALDQIAVSARTPPPVDRLLRQLHLAVCDVLKDGSNKANSKDGLDCAVLAFSHDMTMLDFAAAAIDLHVVPETGMVKRLRGHRLSLGYGKTDLNIPDGRQSWPVGSNSFVIASDGLTTQIGAQTKRAFGNRRLGEALNKVVGNDPAKLVRQLARDLNRWQGSEERRDDVTVLAFKPAAR